jgi:hypothetical protein
MTRQLTTDTSVEDKPNTIREKNQVIEEMHTFSIVQQWKEKKKLQMTNYNNILTQLNHGWVRLNSTPSLGMFNNAEGVPYIAYIS